MTHPQQDQGTREPGETPAVEEQPEQHEEQLTESALVEEVSIDGMCGVY